MRVYLSAVTRPPILSSLRSFSFLSSPSLVSEAIFFIWKSFHLYLLLAVEGRITCHSSSPAIIFLPFARKLTHLIASRLSKPSISLPNTFSPPNQELGRNEAGSLVYFLFLFFSHYLSLSFCIFSGILWM